MNIIPKNILEKDKKIKIVFELINDLLKCGTIQNGNGYCLAMADLFQKLLSFNGVESDLVECSLLIIDSNHNPPQLTLIGYESNLKTATDQMQNHVVLVTKTSIPLLIDLSVFNRVEGVPHVIGTLDEDESTTLSSISINNALFKYSKKPVSSIPYLHQKSIIDKIKHDEKVSHDLQLIKKLIIVLFFISGSNLVRGMYDHYQKYIVKDNGFGPNKEVIVHKEEALTPHLQY